MKKINLLLLIFSILSILKSNAQGFYTKIGFRVGFETSQHSTLNNYTQIEDGNYTIESVKLSLGAGAYPEFSIGYMINKNIGFQIAFSRPSGNNISTSQTFPLLSDYENTLSINGQMDQITPGIMIITEEGKLKPYAKFGLVIGIGKIAINTVRYHIYDLTFYPAYDLNRTNYRIELNGGFAIGVNSGLGVNYSLDDNFNLFTEFNFISLNYTPTNKYETEETSPVDGYYFFPNNGPKPNIPESYSFSSIGGNFGIMYSF